MLVPTQAQVHTAEHRPEPLASRSPSSPMSSFESALNRPLASVEDPSKSALLADRVRGALTKSLYPEPRRIAPGDIGISPLNRLFSVHQVHNAILSSFVNEGFDPDRPHVGICCEVRDPVAREALERYNVNMSSQSPLMPIVEPGRIQYEGLANTHFNVALRLVQKAAYSPAGDLSKLKEERPSLAHTATEGHKWIVLPESLAESLKKDISAWRNDDQNKNQPLTDAEMIRMALVSVHAFLGKDDGHRRQLPLHQIVSHASHQTPLRVPPAVIAASCKFVCGMAACGALPLVQEFLQFWTSTVDPKTIAVSHQFFEAMSKTKPLEPTPFLRLHMTMAMYCAEGVVVKAPPSPHQAGLLSKRDMETLEKKDASPLVPLAESALQNLHEVYRPLLASQLPAHSVRSEVVCIGSLIVRLLFGKPLDSEQFVKSGDASTWLKSPVTTGKVTQDKLNAVQGWWAAHIEEQYPSLNFARDSGLHLYLPAVALEVGEVFEIPAASSSAAPEAPRPQPLVLDLSPEEKAEFRVGQALHLAHRITINLPLPQNPDYRRDLKEGAEVHVTSLADPQDRSRVEIKACIVHQGVAHEVVTWVDRSRLRVPESEDSGSQEQDQDGTEDNPFFPGEILKSNDFGNEVSLVRNFETLIDSHTPAANLASLKAQAIFAMRAILDVTPPLEEGLDVLVVHRSNASGAKRTEVWTARGFEPLEIMIAPWSTEIKERLYTHNQSVSLRVPEGSVPGNRVLAIDGRGQGHLEHPVSADKGPGVLGNLFWVIPRTSERKLANLTLEYSHVQAANSSALQVVLPGGKTRKVKLGAKSLPHIPMLTNKKAVPKNTMLLAMDDPVVAKAREDDKAIKAEEAKTKQAGKQAKKRALEDKTPLPPLPPAKTARS